MYNDFNFSASKILPEITIITPDTFNDHRGTLYTDYLDSVFEEKFNIMLGHSKFAYNKKNVLRGIHGDFESWKLVQCVYGEIFQVVVDCRPKSINYLRHDFFEFNHSEPKMILIPPGFGNAFMSLTEDSVYNYKLAYDGSYNDCDEQFTYKWNDPLIGIQWPTNSPILSKRDESQ